jgi:hypothetical protein
MGIDLHQLYAMTFDDGDPFLSKALHYLHMEHSSSSASLNYALPRLLPRLSRSYLALAPKPLCSKFAALRFNRARLQSQQFERHLSDSSSCPVRPSTPETVAHLLFDCPRLMVPRHNCFQSIEASNITITPPLLLGDYSAVRKSLIPSTHRSVSAFIESISSVCHF